MILTTTIGSFPKPDFLRLPDWFQGDKGTDTDKPTANWKEAMSALGDNKESLIEKAVREVIDDQINCGIDIVTDGEVRRENYIHHHCRNINGIDFDYLTKKSARTGNFDCYLPTIVSKVNCIKFLIGSLASISSKLCVIDFFSFIFSRSDSILLVLALISSIASI